MAFQDVVIAAKTYIPDLNISYKDQSKFMKILGKILFFNPSFMTSFITTIGSTIYFPTETWVNENQLEATEIINHEMTHIQDSKKITNPLYIFLYLSPQILFLLFIPLLFVNWIAALCMFLFLTPIPSYFRMYFERRGYFVSLYALNALNKKTGSNIDLEKAAMYFVTQFTTSSYYFMYPFKSYLINDFNIAALKIKNNQIPLNDSTIFSRVDALVEKL